MNDLPDIKALMGKHQEVAAQRAYVLEESIVRSIRELRADWVRLAQYLYEFHESRAHTHLGYETLDLWLAGPDIELGRRQFYSLVEAYREFVIERGATPEQLGRVDVTKIRETIPALRRGHVDVADAIADAEVLTRTDLEEKYRHRDPVAGMDRSIKPDDFHIEVCKECGAKRKVRHVQP